MPLKRSSAGGGLSESIPAPFSRENRRQRVIPPLSPPSLPAYHCLCCLVRYSHANLPHSWPLSLSLLASCRHRCMLRGPLAYRCSETNTDTCRGQQGSFAQRLHLLWSARVLEFRFTSVSSVLSARECDDGTSDKIEYRCGVAGRLRAAGSDASRRRSSDTR